MYFKEIILAVLLVLAVANGAAGCKSDSDVKVICDEYCKSCINSVDQCVAKLSAADCVDVKAVAKLLLGVCPSAGVDKACKAACGCCSDGISACVSLCVVIG